MGTIVSLARLFLHTLCGRFPHNVCLIKILKSYDATTIWRVPLAGKHGKNTIQAYLFTIRDYFAQYKDLSKKNLLLYKTYLIENRKAKTVNLRLQAINRYLAFAGKNKWRLKSVKVQQCSFLENVISHADYVFLKNQLKQGKKLEWYFVVRVW